MKPPSLASADRAPDVPTPARATDVAESASVDRSPTTALEPSPALAEALATRSRGDAGRAPQPAVRHCVERTTGVHLGEARVMEGPEPAAWAEALQARAFAAGSKVYLGSGEDPSDTRLMAHELAHVAQTRGTRPDIRREGEECEEFAAAESEAESVADEAVEELGETSGVQAIVEDDVAAGTGQMTRSEFLSALRASVTGTASEMLGPLWRGACPYIDQWFDRHGSDNATRLDHMAQLYTGLRPESGADRYVEAAATRLRQAIIQWSRGEASVTELVGAAEPDAAAASVRSMPDGTSGAPAHPSAAAVGGLGDGRPLESGVAGRIGGLIGQSLPEVRVHTDAAASRVARDAGAHAFAFGSHIAFAEGRFRPGTLAGDLLLAHEAAHVAQQAGTAGGFSHSVGVDESRAEADADRATREAARSWLAGEPAAQQARLFAPLRIRRCEDCGGGTKEIESVPEKTPPSPRADEKALSQGKMKWDLRPQGNSSAEMDVFFFPGSGLKSKSRTVTFLQTVIQTQDGTRLTGDDPTGDFAGGKNYEEAKTGARLDFILKRGPMAEEFDPFFGAKWDDAAGKWTAESARSFPWRHDAPAPSPAPNSGSGSGSGSDAGTPTTTPSSPTGAEAAHLYDNPQFNIAMGEKKAFETVAVVPETGEILGSLKWSFEYTRTQGRKFAGATQADCTEKPSAAFTGAVEKYYEQRYTTIDGFDPDTATLTSGHEKALDAFIAGKGSGSQAIRVQGFAASGEKDPPAVAKQRAEAVKTYLTSHGIAADRVKVESFGAEWARVAVGSAGADARNRRVQIAVSGK